MNEKQKKRILLPHRDTLAGNIIPGFQSSARDKSNYSTPSTSQLFLPEFISAGEFTLFISLEQL